MRLTVTLAAFLLMALVTAPLAGCVYDHAQHTDRVSYRGGNAVAQNLEAETINPSKPSMYSKAGLGKNGVVAGTTGTSTSVSAPPSN